MNKKEVEEKYAEIIEQGAEYTLNYAVYSCREENGREELLDIAIRMYSSEKANFKKRIAELGEWNSACEKRFKQEQEKNVNLSDENTVYFNSWKEAKRENDPLKEEIMVLKNVGRQQKRTIEELREEIKTLKEQLSFLECHDFKMQRIASLEDEVKKLSNLCTVITEDRNQELEELREHIKTLKDVIQVAKKEKEDLERSNNELVRQIEYMDDVTKRRKGRVF